MRKPELACSLPADTSAEANLCHFLDCAPQYHLQIYHGSYSSTAVGATYKQGGKSLRTVRDFLLRLYNVSGFKESAAKILDVINTQVPSDNVLILMGHNGPAGLGSERYNICGVDWGQEAGDHGDPDFQVVLQHLQQAGRHVALVLFGHMHHTLRGAASSGMWSSVRTGISFLSLPVCIMTGYDNCSSCRLSVSDSSGRWQGCIQACSAGIRILLRQALPLTGDVLVAGQVVVCGRWCMLMQPQALYTSMQQQFREWSICRKRVRGMLSQEALLMRCPKCNIV